MEADAVRRKLAEAELRAQTLLNEMNEIDAELGKLTPADPKRAELKAAKAEKLSRYHGTKACVKDLRRTLNSSTPARIELMTGMPKGPDRGLLELLYSALSAVRDRDHTEEFLKPSEAKTIDEFLESMDPE